MYDEALVYAEMLYNSNNTPANLEILCQVLYQLNRRECVFHFIEKESKHISLTERLLCLYGLSSNNCAIEKVSKAIKLYLVKNQGSEFIHIVYAKLCRRNGNATLSKRHFEKAVELNPLLIDSYKEATRLGANINHALFINKEEDTIEDAPDSPIMGDPGIVTRAHNTFLQSNLNISKSNLKIATKSLKRKASQVKSIVEDESHLIKRQRLNAAVQSSKNEFSNLDSNFISIISAFDLVSRNNFKEAYVILSDVDLLNNDNPFASILRILCQHELNCPISDVLFSISEHLERYEFYLLGMEHIIVILWIYQDINRLSDLSLFLIKAFPNTFQSLLCQAALLILKGQPTKSVSLLEEAIKLDESALTAGVAAWFVMSDDQFELALKWFTIAKKRNPIDPRVLTGLGYVLMRTNNIQNALMYLQDSERLKPNSETNKKLLAEVFRKSDKLTEAYDTLQHALEEYPHDKGLLNEKVILCIKMNLINVIETNLGSHNCTCRITEIYHREPAVFEDPACAISSTKWKYWRSTRAIYGCSSRGRGLNKSDAEWIRGDILSKRKWGNG